MGTLLTRVDAALMIAAAYIIPDSSLATLERGVLYFGRVMQEGCS
jgi:hypothetical protein